MYLNPLQLVRVIFVRRKKNESNDINVVCKYLRQYLLSLFKFFFLLLFRSLHAFLELIVRNILFMKFFRFSA